MNEISFALAIEHLTAEAESIGEVQWREHPGIWQLAFFMLGAPLHASPERRQSIRPFRQGRRRCPKQSRSANCALS